MNDQIDIQRDVWDALQVTRKLHQLEIVPDALAEYALGLGIWFIAIVGARYSQSANLMSDAVAVPVITVGAVLAVVALVCFLAHRGKYRRYLQERELLQKRAVEEIAALEAKHPKALVAAAKPYRDLLIRLDPGTIADLLNYQRVVGNPLYYLDCARSIRHHTADHRRVEAAQLTLAD